MSAGLLAARLGIVAAGVVWGCLAAVYAYGVDQPWLWVTDAAVTVAFAGVAAAALPRARGAGILAVLVALTWTLASLVPATMYWHRGALLVLILAAPRVWPRRWAVRAAALVVLGISATPYVWSSDGVAFVVALGMGAMLAILNARARLPLPAAGFVACVVFAASAAWRWILQDASTLDLRSIVYALGLVAVACLAAAALSHNPAATLVDAVVRVRPEAGSLRDRMAAAVGDPALRLESGAREPARPDGDGRAVIPVMQDGEPIAHIVCAPAVAADSQTREALARAVRLAAESARLDAELSARAEEVSRSRERLLNAGDAERAEVRRLLDVDVADPLARLAARLSAAGSRAPGALDRAAELFARCAAQLREVSTGLPPAELDDGLSAAVGVLAANAPLPVEVAVDPAVERSAMSAALFYICAEALSNTVKHARATRVSIEVTVDGDDCRTRIRDDGRGGAVVGVTGGLAGLKDRVDTQGGSMTVGPAEGGGTDIRIVLPLRPRALAARERVMVS